MIDKMSKLYLGYIKKGYEIPKEIVKKYDLKVGKLSPWTGLPIISEEYEKNNIDIKEISSSNSGIDIKEIKNDIDIKEIKSDIDIKEI